MPAYYDVTFGEDEPVLLTSSEFSSRLLEHGFSVSEAVYRTNELIKYGAVQLGTVYRAVWREDKPREEVISG